MYTLAIDTSGRHCTLALLSDDELVLEIDSRVFLPFQAKSAFQSNQPTKESQPSVRPGISVTLFTALEALFSQSSLSIQEMSLISVAVGPGSFTGLRVGVVMAKTLAYVNRTPLIAVNTLEAIAAQVAESREFKDREIEEGKPSQQTIRPVVNAQRKQLFGAAFQRSGLWSVERRESDQLIDRQQWLDQLNENDWIAGSGLEPMTSQIETFHANSEVDFQIASPQVWDCSAVAVGQIGRRHFLAGQESDFWSMEPLYFRPSYAEETISKQP